MMACPEGGREFEFLRDLQAARIWFIRDDALYLDLFADAGTMKFVTRPDYGI